MANAGDSLRDFNMKNIPTPDKMFMRLKTAMDERGIQTPDKVLKSVKNEFEINLLRFVRLTEGK
jgi:hypothetical protein